MSITKEKIRQAVLDIRSEHRVPTNAAVREHLGGGSFSTISKLLSEVLDDLAKEEVREVLDPVPEEIAEFGSATFQKLWLMAVESASKRFQADKQMLEGQLKDAQEKQEATAKDLAAVLEENAVLEGKVADLTKKLDFEQGQNRSMEVERRMALETLNRLKGERDTFKLQNEVLISMLSPVVDVEKVLKAGESKPAEV